MASRGQMTMTTVAVLAACAWLGWRVKGASDSRDTIAGRYPVERINMSPSACAIHPVKGVVLARLFNFRAFGGLRPDGTRRDDAGDHLQTLPPIQKFGTTFDAYSTVFGRLEVGTTAGELVNGSAYQHELLYLYPHTSDLSLFLNSTVLNQLPSIGDRQIGIFNDKGDAEIIIEVKNGQITFIEWTWE